MKPSDPNDPDLPEALRRDLRAVFGRRVEETRSVDEAVRTAAKLHLRRRRAWVGRVAAAAAAVLVLALSARWFATRSGTPVGREVAKADFDGNGRVDILDAYRLALRITNAEPVSDRWDQDGDGRVDAADVELVARRAVAVGRQR